MIRADEITFRAGGKVLVDSVSLEMKEGEVLAILGPNGAGKSTLFKMLCGQNWPDSGGVFYGDRPLPRMEARRLARCRAVLPQTGQIPFDFTAWEVAMLGRSPHSDGSESRKDAEIVRKAMELTETGWLADRIVGTLSGGELQRVHLARVLAQIWEPVGEDGRTLFLDEPTASLDPAHQHSSLQLARKWAAQGVAVAVILHDLNLASLYADRLLLMKGGKSPACGTPREVLRADTVWEVFDLRVKVLSHPERDCPMVIAL